MYVISVFLLKKPCGNLRCKSPDCAAERWSAQCKHMSALLKMVKIQTYKSFLMTKLSWLRCKITNGAIYQILSVFLLQQHQWIRTVEPTYHSSVQSLALYLLASCLVSRRVCKMLLVFVMLLFFCIISPSCILYLFVVLIYLLIPLCFFVRCLSAGEKSY